MQQPVQPRPSANGYGRRKVEKEVGTRLESKVQSGKSTSRQFAGVGKGGAYQSPSRDRLVYLTTCLVGHQVEVQVLDGSVFSGILHAANTEKDSGIILKMAHLIKDSTEGMKNTSETFSKPPSKTLIIPGKEFVQVTAKGVPVTLDGFRTEFILEKQQELLTDSCISQSRHNEVERQLERWVPDDDAPECPELENIFDGHWNRYKKLLRTVDLTKDFFFSYSYHIMLSLQKNLSNCETGLTLYDTMFVWNEFLTRGIRYQLKNTLWTVALVYGFFKQVTLSISNRDFVLTLIARRSRHYAGTRYLKRGVNEKGRVANDVETEQIVLEDMRDGCPVQISAVVQNRGSIPLFWSQETSRLNIKPDIILSRKDLKFEATKRHFENLVKRYGNPIIILNLIKTREKRPRETILRAAFANAIEFINKDLSEENHLRFLHWDLNKHSRSKATNVLTLLGKVAATALDLTGFLHCQLIPASKSGKLLKFSSTGNTGDQAGKDLCEVGAEPNSSSGDLCGDYYVKLSTLQRGVLRTNCIDCLDRTNVAQYAYGLVALGHQLHALGFIDVENIDLDSALADNLMKLYEAMGDTLALQYGGSAAHNKIFSERRGQWKAATQSQELFRTLQRYYSNAYMDAEKQDAINVFLGHFRPQEGKPALWELDSDQHYNVGGHGSSLAMENSRSFIKRSLSEGNLICGSSSPVKETETEQTDDSDQPLPESAKGGSKGLSESTPEISTCETDISFTRYTPSMSGRQLFLDMQLEQCLGSESVRLRERVDSVDFSNFLDIEWLSSSGNSCEEETYERSAIISSPSGVTVGSKAEISFSASESSLKRQEQTSGDLNFDAEGSSKSINEFSEMFVHWVNNGDMLFP